MVDAIRCRLPRLDGGQHLVTARTLAALMDQLDDLIAAIGSARTPEISKVRHTKRRVQ